MIGNPAHPFDWLIEATPQGMSPNEIKSRLALAGKSLKEVAKEIGQEHCQVRQTVRYLVRHSVIRTKLTEQYGIRFDDRPLRKAAVE